MSDPADLSEGAVLAAEKSDCYRKNIAALQTFQPAVADEVEAVSIPPGVATATGRDGSKTFLLPVENAPQAWFGASSMPTISAVQTLGGVRGDGHNVILPGIFTGLEPIVILERVPPHSALFVLEADPLNLKLAMRLHDYTSFIDQRRLVFVPGEGVQIVESLAAFFGHHSGFELPVHLLPAPQCSPAYLARLQGYIERAGEIVTDAAAERVEALKHWIRQRSPRAIPDQPRVVLLCIDPTPVVLDHAHRAQRALTKLGWPHTVCVPDAPDRCHLSARLQAVIDAGAELILMINGDGGLMRSLVPDDLPIVVWYVPGAILNLPLQDEGVLGPAPHDIVAATSQALHDRLIDAGVPVPNLLRLDVAADDVAYHPIDSSHPEAAAPAPHVAILSDHPDDRPESCDIGHASHVALWNAIQQQAVRYVDENGMVAAQRLLEDAERKTEITLETTEVRTHFIDLINTHIIPATLARVAADALRNTGCSVQLWGRHWHPPQRDPNETGRDIPTGPQLNSVFHGAGIVLIPDALPASIQTALDALAAGVAVILRAPTLPFAQSYPGLESLAPFIHFYTAAHQLPQLIAQLTTDDSASATPPHDTTRSTLVAARSAALARHSVARRLQTLVDHLRHRSSTITPHHSTTTPCS